MRGKERGPAGEEKCTYSYISLNKKQSYENGNNVPVSFSILTLARGEIQDNACKHAKGGSGTQSRPITTERTGKSIASCTKENQFSIRLGRRARKGKGDLICIRSIHGRNHSTCKLLKKRRDDATLRRAAGSENNA